MPYERQCRAVYRGVPLLRDYSQGGTCGEQAMTVLRQRRTVAGNPHNTQKRQINRMPSAMPASAGASSFRGQRLECHR